jgi:hypothetical protein
MEFRKQKPKHAQSQPDSSERPVRRERIEAARRRASQLNDVIETKALTGSGDDLVRQRQKEIQQQLAQLRSEAVQARRLAEHIHNLSHEATAQKRRSVMSDTPAVHKGQEEQLGRRVSDSARATGSQSRFNPLHPSMDLPPEQLIRLLGLEDKMARKHHRSAAPQATKSSVPAAAPVGADRTSPVPESDFPRLQVPVEHRKRPQRHTDAEVFGQRSNRKWMLAGIGIAGIAAAGLFWWQPATEPAHPNPTFAPPTPVSSPAPAAEVQRPTATLPAPETQAPAAPADPAAVDNAEWEAAVASQEQRLRAAAAQRLHERMQSGESSAAESTVATPPDSIAPVLPAVSAQPDTLDGENQADTLAPVPTDAEFAPASGSLPSDPVSPTTVEAPETPVDSPEPGFEDVEGASDSVGRFGIADPVDVISDETTTSETAPAVDAMEPAEE